ncbi:MAG: tRNA pseudouridine(38-40) synthase TruA [Cyclobacteriaceae bacterium]|nr:tRNA pseudouridine(38-40) synthase TruA [Cyclobacteriaceae bacterium]
MRLFFEVAYKGTNYHGWQIQQNAVTVQGEINKVISTICQQDINITGSGRTDTGVHCEQQFFHADIDSTWSLEDLQFKMNSMLPFDIAINSICEVNKESHSRFDAISRTYEYRINTKKNPFLKDESYYYNKPLDIPVMNQAATLLTHSEQDFECFSKIKTEVNHFRCNITNAEWKKENDILIFNITANRFLRGMVRAIVGTLIEVGLKKITIADFAEIIASKDRTKAGRAAPPEGLFLTTVSYPKDIFK